MTVIRIACKHDQKALLELVGQYHAFESIPSTVDKRRESITPLLTANSLVGYILVAELTKKLIGYIAVCVSYSIEFGGYDAFIDELYITEQMRGKGIGSKLIESAKMTAKERKIKGLHLEVARNNLLAKKFYRRLNFVSREKYELMSCAL